MTLAIFYTGDVRHNQEIAEINHKKLIARLREICEVNVYKFTRDDPLRGHCPYDDVNQPDTRYRRGQGGAIQVWDFLRGVDRTTEDVVMKLRTDLWFTNSSIDVICNEMKEVIEGRTDIAYFGSDWVNDTAGEIDRKLSFHVDQEGVIQDFVIIARRAKLNSFQEVISHLDTVNPNKRRSGNKTFRYIIPVGPGVPGFREQRASVYRILCQIWLIRRDYINIPIDDDVCRDYLQSYISDDKAKMGKKNEIYPHPMQAAIDWWRAQPPRQWPPKELKIGEWTSWQSE
jgi:hypothetical protein